MHPDWVKTERSSGVLPKQYKCYFIHLFLFILSLVTLHLWKFMLADKDFNLIC